MTGFGSGASSGAGAGAGFFFGAAFLATGFFAVTLLAAAGALGLAFLAAGFFAAGFLAATLFAAGLAFLAAGFFAAGFFLAALAIFLISMLMCFDHPGIGCCELDRLPDCSLPSESPQNLRLFFSGARRSVAIDALAQNMPHRGGYVS
jgi:hypothetical protein